MRALARWTGPDLGRALRQALQARLRVDAAAAGDDRAEVGKGFYGEAADSLSRTAWPPPTESLAAAERGFAAADGISERRSGDGKRQQ